MNNFGILIHILIYKFNKLDNKLSCASVNKRLQRPAQERWQTGYNLCLCWQTPVCQILVRDGEPPKLGFKGPISLVAAAGTFFGKLIQ
jgi:hypothetical protein